MARGLGQDVATNAAEQSEPDFGVALEDRADQIHGEMVVEQPEPGPRGQLDSGRVFPDCGRAVEEDDLHLETRTDYGALCDTSVRRCPAPRGGPGAGLIRPGSYCAPLSNSKFGEQDLAGWAELRAWQDDDRLSASVRRLRAAYQHGCIRPATGYRASQR